MCATSSWTSGKLNFVIYNDLHSIIYNDSVIIMSGSETQLHDDLLLSERSLLFSQ